MKDTVKITWSTGEIELNLAALSDMPVSRLKEIIAAEEKDPDGVRLL